MPTSSLDTQRNQGSEELRDMPKTSEWLSQGRNTGAWPGSFTRSSSSIYGWRNRPIGSQIKGTPLVLSCAVLWCQELNMTNPPGNLPGTPLTVISPDRCYPGSCCNQMPGCPRPPAPFHLPPSLFLHTYSCLQGHRLPDQPAML